MEKKYLGSLFLNLFALSLIIFAYFRFSLAILVRNSFPNLSQTIFISDKYIIVFLFLLLISRKAIKAVFTERRQGFRQGLRADSALQNELLLFGLLFLLVTWGFISGMVNGNPIHFTIFGTFAYIVYFLIFFIFSNLPFEKRSIEFVYRVLCNLVLALCGISVFQEILALFYPESANWWVTFQSGIYLWRLGFFRAPSLFVHANNMGVITLFFFTIQLALFRRSQRRKDYWKICLLMVAIILTFSKTAYVSALIAIVFLVQGKQKKAILALPFILILGLIFVKSLQYGTEQGKPAIEAAKTHNIYIIGHDRLHGLSKAIEVFKDNPVLGVGPGMFGGRISLKYKSPIYARYGVQPEYYDYITSLGSIEQFYGQILAELGIFGSLLMILLIISPIFMIFNICRQESAPFMRAFIAGMTIIPLQFLISGLGNIITDASVLLLPYFAFLGMVVAVQRLNRG